MLKNLLKVVTTSTLLFGCYLGYVRAFNLVVRQFQADRRTDITIFHSRDSRSKQHAQDLARLAFGEKHWTVTSDQPYAYYSSEHRFWMYALQYEEIKEENGVRYDGKRLRMKPFAMIWTSGDGKKIQRLTADSATLDLNQPIGLGNKQTSEGVKVLHAHIEGDVRIRDDRGTPVVLTDDMNVGPMTYLDFDDETQQITSESHVDIVDPDQTTIGDGLVIQLRKPDFEARPAQGSSSSGFGGVEFAILKKDVRVVMRDVGQSGMFPGSGPKAATARKKSTTAKTVDVVASTTVKDAAAKDAKSPANDEPVPLLIQSKGPMRIDWPPDRVPVAEGPPAPPVPTLVRFERDVVALHGRIDRQPNQLNCDTLRLTLIPGAPPPPARRDKANADDPGKALARADGQDGSAAATAGDPKAGPDGTAGAAAPQAPASTPNQGLFGNLTLQKAHATGHAVWLQLRQQGSKVRCKEMIHDRRMPYAPDSTAFRGDRTQPIWLEKIDYEPEEPEDEVTDEDGNPLVRSDGSPNRAREVSSVTHVVTASATLYDRGHGLDLADVRAYGPGKLETRPDLKEPVERIAQWQDELIIVNVVGDDDKLRQKQVTLTGTRPLFVDLVKKTRLDSGREIKVFLKPPSPPPAGTATAMSGASPAAADGTRATHLAARPTSADAFASPSDTARKDDAGGADGNAGSGLGGNLQIERLLAYRDVHFLAPNRRMEAREWLDAPFIEVDPPTPTDTTDAAGMDEPANAATDADAPPSPDSTQSQPKVEGPATTPAAGTVAAKESEPQTPAEPGMTGVADRIWAKVALPRGKGIDSEKSQRREKKKAARAAKVASALAATDAAATESTTASPAAAAPKEAEADVREAWLTGNVAIHQDVEPDPNKKDKAKPQGNDIFGEAVYLDNKGKGKAIAQVYHRDPTNPTSIPGPIRWAKVSTDDMIVYGETLWMDQEQDKIWALGPGVLNQWTDRAMLSDKSPEPKPDPELAAARAVAMADDPPAAGAGAGPAQKGTARSDVPTGPPAPPKPRTRAGRPIGDKDLLTITWTKRMEFNGRTTDPSGRPAGRADFFGIVNSQMTDARLYCEQKMIAFTDREVPLAQVGSALGRPGKGGAAKGKDQPERPDGDDEDERTGPNGSRVDIALLYCYGNPVAISRKVDPDVPIVLEKERIDAWDHTDESQGDGKTVFPGRIDYNRRTGEFYVPGPGIVYLYDRPNEGQNKDGASPASAPPANAAPAARGGARPANGRTVTPTATSAPRRGTSVAAPAGRDAAKPRQAAAPATPAVRRTFPPLVLMQVKFNTEMRGRMGAGQANDTRQERWSEFFGDIEFLRSQVLNDGVILNPDDRLEDGFYLTSQILRIIQEPPPAGSPEKTPARSFAKAWDRVHVNKGETMAIEADVTTYDSGTDLLWAYGEGERGVTFAQQAAPGQPLSANYGKAFQYNVKSHAGRSVRSDSLNFIDHKTGARPGNVAMPDPTAPAKKKGKKPFFVPNTNLERRGFTGY